MTCVAVGMGNPFIAAHADAYRNTIDIGAGNWMEQLRACEWALPTIGIEGRKTYLLNMDGLGVNDGSTDDENFTRLTWGYITMGMLEIDGYLERLSPTFVKAIRKLTDRCDRGHRCLCPDERAFTGVPLPNCLHVNFPKGSRTRKSGIVQSVALFNWTDSRQVGAVDRSLLGHTGPVQAENFWTGQQETFADDFLVKTLPPHSSLLFDIAEKGNRQ